MNYIIEFDYKFFIAFLFVYILIVFFMKFKLNKNIFSIFIFTLLYFYFVLLIKETQFDIYINNPDLEEDFGAIKIGRDINIIPFKDFLNTTTVINVIMFIPIGFLQGLIYKSSWIKTIITGFVLSLTIESTQFLVRNFIGINFRRVDVNDLICNTVGAVIGFILLILFVKVLKKLLKQDNCINKYLHSVGF